MVDDLGAAAVHRPIERPVVVHGEQVREPLAVPLLGLPPVEPLARVLDHFSVRRDALGRVDPEPVDLGRPNLHPEGREPRVDPRRLNGKLSHRVHIVAHGGIPVPGVLELILCPPSRFEHTPTCRRFARLDPEEMKNAKVNRATLGRAWGFARAYRGRLIAYLGTIALAALVGTLPPLIFKALIDNALPPAIAIPASSTGCS